jgi:type IV pilus assembly protein PilM
MIRLVRPQIQPIGLDIGHDSVRMLQLEVTGSTLSVLAAAKRAVPAEARQSAELHLAASMDLVRQMMRQNPFHGRQVVAALPRHIVHAKNLRLPNIPASELASAVQFEARNIFPFDVEKAHVEFIHAGEVRQGGDVRQEVIVLAAKHEDVNNFLEQLHRCGVVIESLDVEPCALFRTVQRFIRRKEDENEVHVLVEVGLQRTQVVIGRGNEISFFKSIDIGGGQFDSAVAEKLGINLDEARALRRRMSEGAEAPDNSKRDAVQQAVFDATRAGMETLGKEISLCLRYHSVTFRGQRPACLRLLGGEAADTQLQAVLNTMATLPVEIGKPLFSVDISRMSAMERIGCQSEWAMALGLGLKRTTGRFGARDGKPRQTGKPAPPAVEVVDMNAVLSAAGETRTAEKPEAVHA